MKIQLLNYPRKLRWGKKAGALLGLCWLAVSIDVGAESITLQDALQRTLQDNGELKAYPLIIRGAEAMNLQAGIAPNPRLDIEFENAFGSGEFKSTDRAEISLVMSQLIELGDKRDSRMRFADANTQKLKSEYQQIRLNIASETSRRFYQVLALQSKRALLRTRLQQENKALEIIRKRAKAGAVGDADVSKMMLRVARTEWRQSKLQSELEISRMQLAAMWMGQAKFTSVIGSLTELPELPEQNLVRESVEQWPSMKVQRASQKLAAGKLRLAESNGRSDITLGIGLRQHQLTSDQSLNLSFSMPLALDNPNQGNIRAAQSEVSLSLQQSEVLKQQLVLSLAELLQQLKARYQQASMLKNRLLPQAQQLLAETEQGYQKGRYSVLQWVDAQAELFSIEESITLNYQNIFLSLLELERVTGQSMIVSDSADGKTRNAGEKS